MKFPARAAILASVVASPFTVARPARAQDSGDGFRFQRPSGSWSLRGGYAMPNAGSDIFSFTTSNMTVDRGSFSGLDFGADLSFTITRRPVGRRPGTSDPFQARSHPGLHRLP